MKKNTTIIKTAFGLLVIAFCSAVFVFSANAQTSSSTSGDALEISPTVVVLKADPGETVSAIIKLRDISKVRVIVRAKVNDFSASGESGEPSIDAEEKNPSPYSIKSWVNPMAEIPLEPKQVKNLPISISVPTDAAPGGYYGIIRFTSTPPELEETGLALSGSIGSLIFIKVNGDAKEGLSIESFEASHENKTNILFESTPIQFAVRLKNTGNMYEQPVGKITITDMFNKKVTDVNVNLDQKYVLPQSIRKFTQSLDSGQIGNKMLFGRYKADLRVAYGTKGQILTKSIEFWIIPYRLIGVIIVIITITLVFLYFAVKRYNRFIIRKSQNPRPKHKRHGK